MPKKIQPWQRKEVIGDATLYLGDCLDILPHMGIVDAVVTDPPYGIGWARSSWDDSPKAYSALMLFLVGQSSRIVKNGWCFVFQSMKNVGRFHEWFPEGFRLFAACKNFAQIRPTGVFHSWDPVVFWSIGVCPRNSTRLNRDYYVGNVAGQLTYKLVHPSPKPLDTMTYIVELAAPVEGIVLDPFMGSGTTGVAALQLHRKFIGIEIDPKYFDIACERIEQAHRQPTFKFE